MKNIIIHTKLAFLNLISDKVFWILEILSLMAIIPAYLLSGFSLHQDQKVLWELGFGFTYFIILAGAIILPFRLEIKQKDRRSIAGLFLGLFSSLLLIYLISTIILSGLLSLKNIFNPFLILHSAPALFESALLAILALLIAAKINNFAYIKKVGAAILLLTLLLSGSALILNLESDERLNNNFRGFPQKADLGLDSAVADIYWLKTIQYYGEKQEKYDLLDDYLAMVTEFDPQFTEAYAFGVINLPSMGYAKAGISLGEKALRNGVSDWRIPFYLAANYYINGNKERALYYFDLASKSENVPNNIKNELNIDNLRNSLVK